MAIYIGYPGVGKSTLAGKERFIDLESNNFTFNKIGGGTKKFDKWYIPYTKIAVELSSQGYDVFISSHKEVRDYLKMKKGLRDTAANIVGDEELLKPFEVYTITPDLSLEKEWVEKLWKRYQENCSNKNRAAYERAKDFYKEDVTDILNSGFNNIIIDNMEYDLEDMLYERG